MTTFVYQPSEYERERASNSYLMSLIAVMAGLPIPIINLIATFIFFLANRKGTYFVRWHCIQALASQLSLLIINSIGWWWTVSVFFRNNEISNSYIAYIICVFIFNITDFIATMVSAGKTRKGIHHEWWFFGPLTNLICKP